MKLRSGWIALLVAGMLVACSEDDNGSSSLSGGTLAPSGGTLASSGGTTSGGSGGMPSDASVVDDGSDLCGMVCASVLQLECENDGSEQLCLASCMGVYALGACTEEVGPYFMCLAALEAGAWECDSSGEAAPKSGYCDAEAESLSLCVDTYLEG